LEPNSPIQSSPGADHQALCLCIVSHPWPRRGTVCGHSAPQSAHRLDYSSPPPFGPPLSSQSSCTAYGSPSPWPLFPTTPSPWSPIEPFPAFLKIRCSVCKSHQSPSVLALIVKCPWPQMLWWNGLGIRSEFQFKIILIDDIVVPPKIVIYFLSPKKI
jgi:hypothetical protein